MDHFPSTPHNQGGGTYSTGEIGDPHIKNGDCGCAGCWSIDQEDGDEDGIGNVCDD